MTGGWIQTWLGHAVDLEAPDLSAIDIYDIAHHLSRLNRFGGALWPEHYSVAEHSIHVATVVKLRGGTVEEQRAAIMHDAAEAYCGDVVQPLKRLLPRYNEILAGFEAAIVKRFALPEELPSNVTRADVDMLLLERDMLHSRPPRDWGLPSWAEKPEGIELRCWGPNEAKIEFLWTARGLGVC